jgi:hypothetical protein
MLYGAINVAFALLLVVGASLAGASLAQFPYVLVLFALCTSPLPFVDRLNGPFAMLGVTMAVYFFEFGALDAITMLRSPGNSFSIVPEIGYTEMVICLGAIAQLVAFHGAVRLLSGRRAGVQVHDWPRGLLAPVGLLLWIAGSAASLYHNLVVQIDNTALSIQGGLAKLGIWGASTLILVENYAGPLGIMILAYWWAVWRRRYSTPLLLTLMVVQFAVGWVVDTKEVAISAPVVALLTRFIVLGKLPWRWVVGVVLGVALVFPILSAKRLVMTEEMQLTRIQALPRTFEILMRTLEERDAIRSGKYEQRSETLIERESVKANVDLIIKGTASSHPYKLGSTFEPLLYVFLPRVLWSSKPSVNSAVTLNREFHISADPDTFISPSHLGEWYWNFGLPGALFGMCLSGALLGYLFVRFDPGTGASVTRVLVVIVTLYLLVARSEGQLEIQYVLWARSMLLIGLLHGLARRVGGARAPQSAATIPQAYAGEALVRFPNLLR